MSKRIVLLQALASISKDLARIVGNVDLSVARQRPFANAWSMNDVLSHLCDVDVRSLARMQRVVNEERPIIRTIHPDETSHDTTVLPDQLLAQFEQARGNTITYLQNLGAGQWQRKATFDSGEETTVRTLVQILIEHDTQHLNQLIEIKERAGLRVVPVYTESGE
jgi:uncharacterized damage-inducible protein DinB